MNINKIAKKKPSLKKKQELRRKKNISKLKWVKLVKIRQRDI